MRITSTVFLTWRRSASGTLNRSSLERDWGEEAWRNRVDRFRNDYDNTCKRMIDSLLYEAADPELKTLVLEGIGHFPQLEAPELFNESLARLVDGLGGQ
jgi:pimeloyl-ACP methyl ester carboxylesterase